MSGRKEKNNHEEKEISAVTLNDQRNLSSVNLAGSIEKKKFNLKKNGFFSGKLNSWHTIVIFLQESLQNIYDNGSP